MGRLIAIGDIHGCYHTMVSLLSKLHYDSSSDTLVFLGDYMDRGDNSYEVLSQLKHLQDQLGKDKVICLKGNHEQMAIDYFRKEDTIWLFNGSEKTLESFANNGVNLEDFLPWLDALPLVYETPEIIFCHAGLSSPLLKDNTKDDILWGRDWIKSDSRPREKQVIFGHTPLHVGRVYETLTGDICIDAGCVFGGSLSALILDEDGKTEIVYEEKSVKD